MDQTHLIVIDSPPYGDWRGREALDMAFSLAAFDRPVALLFRGEGVNWLRPGQKASPSTRRQSAATSVPPGCSALPGCMQTVRPWHVLR